MFCINVQLHNILLRFMNIFGSIFSYLISERCDGRTEKRGSFYYYYYLKRLAMQGRKREIDTLSVRRPQPHTTNL